MPTVLGCRRRLCHAGRVVDELLAAGQRYAATFDGQGKVAAPTRRLALLTCMDSRIDPAAIFGFALGEAIVVRNAGGRATDDAIRSLVLGSGLLGVEHVIVMHHTDCALGGQSEDSVRARLRAAGLTAAEPARFMAMPDADVALREDVEALRRSPLLPRRLEIVGWRYDVATGGLATIVPSDAG
jgi:carbonic anhydrase